MLTNLLPAGLRPYAKAVYPFIATIIAVVVTAIITKQPLDVETLKVAIMGLVATLLAFLAPNKPYVQPGPGAVQTKRSPEA